MSADELASVRAMVAWSEDVDENGARIRGPVQPEVSEVSTGSCEWDADPETGTPYGEVARADPRWGRVVVMCATGSDGFAALVNQTLLLVGRAGTSGPFTRVAAHTNMSWSVNGQPLRHPRRVADTGGAAGRARVLHPVPVLAARRAALSGRGPNCGHVRRVCAPLAPVRATLTTVWVVNVQYTSVAGASCTFCANSAPNVHSAGPAPAPSHPSMPAVRKRIALRQRW